MRIYSNKKRPVKASNDGRKWVNTELTQDEYAKFRNFLKQKGYKYETSEAGDMVHIEAYLNEAEIKEADKFLDTLDDVNGACGKKSVKASEQADDIVMYWGGSKVYEGPADGSMTREIKWFLDDPECLQQIVDYCNSFGDPVITDTSDLMDVAATFVQLVGYEISEAEAMGDDVYISDDLGSFEIIPASQEVTGSVKRGRMSVKASEIDELEDDTFINALWEACDDIPQLIEINYEATEGIIFIFNHVTDDYDGREASLISALEAAGYDAEYLANNGSNVIVLDVREKGVNASVTSRKDVKASETSVTAAIDDGMHIIIDSKAYVDVTEDDFEQGAVGPYVNSWEFDVRGEYNSIGELVRAISENSYVFSEDVGDYYYMDGSIRTSATVDVDNSKATDAQIDAWQRGEEKLYVADMYLAIKVGTVHEMTEDEARDFGISIY